MTIFAGEISVGDFFLWSRLLAPKQAQSSFPTSARYSVGYILYILFYFDGTLGASLVLLY